MSNLLADCHCSNLTLITGGARSGKSRFAEALASQARTPVIYLATMEEVGSDREAVERIQHHRERRPPQWQTIEQARNVHDVINQFDDHPTTCIFDCLSLYVSNILLDGYNEESAFLPLEQEILGAAKQLLLAIERKSSVHFLVVTNEVGYGIVPENGLARLYRDLLGLTNQMFAAASSEVWLSCVGLQLRLKPNRD